MKSDAFQGACKNWIFRDSYHSHSLPFRILAFLCPMGEGWCLESLTIGPMTHRTDGGFWRDAFLNFPPIPHLKDTIIIYYYPNNAAFRMSTWGYFNTFFCQTNIFSQTMRMDIRVHMACWQGWGSTRTNYVREQLFLLRSCRSVTFNGGEYGAF